MRFSRIKLVVIGGGTGTSAVLRGLKRYIPNLTAIVNMVDNGGSSGVLRDEHGLLPPGDVRQCLLALSNASPEKQRLFGYRFEEGALAGHSFGNLFIGAAQKTTGDFTKALALAAEFLEVTGTVLPATLDDAHLHLTRNEGRVEGQSQVDAAIVLDSDGKPSFTLSLEPRTTITPAAAKALTTADAIIIAPGDLYTSLAPVLLVDGVAEALRQSVAPLIYVCNLTTKQGHTTNFSVEDHAAAIERLIAADTPRISHVLYNTAAPTEEMLAQLNANEAFVTLGASTGHTYHMHGSDLIAPEIVVHRRGDKLQHRRSRIWHDSEALGRVLAQLLEDI